MAPLRHTHTLSHTCLVLWLLVIAANGQVDCAQAKLKRGITTPPNGTHGVRGVEKVIFSILQSLLKHKVLNSQRYSWKAKHWDKIRDSFQINTKIVLRK